MSNLKNEIKDAISELKEIIKANQKKYIWREIGFDEHEWVDILEYSLKHNVSPGYTIKYLICKAIEIIKIIENNKQ